MDPEARTQAPRARTILQAAGDHSNLPDAHVLDLGAARGLYTREFAHHARHVTALEGRRTNAEHIRAHGLENVTVLEQDVRELQRDQRYDLVLCLGLLYHLDAPAAIELAHTMATIAPVAIVDTQFALKPRATHDHGDRTYSGQLVREFDPDATPEQQERLSRSGLRNPDAFWLTRPSLYNLLADAGYTTVTEIVAPFYRGGTDRTTLIAIRGPKLDLATFDGPAPFRREEREQTGVHPAASWRGRAKRRIAPHLPARLKG